MISRNFLGVFNCCVKKEALNDKHFKRLVLEVKTSNKAKRGQSFENVVPGMCAMHRGFFGRFRCKRDHPDFGRCYTCIRAALGIQTTNIHKCIQNIYRNKNLLRAAGLTWAALIGLCATSTLSGKTSFKTSTLIS